MQKRSALILVLMWLIGCATIYKVHPPDDDQDDSLRVGEVMEIYTRADITGPLRQTYEIMLDSGVADSEIQDGSLVAVRVYCCGGPSEYRNSLFILVPQGLAVDEGDILEIKMGRQPAGEDTGRINTAFRVREKAGKSESERSCRWVPENPSLWMRILYCDWMEDEGWIEVGGNWKTWLKHAQ